MYGMRLPVTPMMCLIEKVWRHCRFCSGGTAAFVYVILWLAALPLYTLDTGGTAACMRRESAWSLFCTLSWLKLATACALRCCLPSKRVADGDLCEVLAVLDTYEGPLHVRKDERAGNM